MPTNGSHPAGGEGGAGSRFHPSQPGYGTGLHLLRGRTVKQDLSKLVFDLEPLGGGLWVAAILRHKGFTGGGLLGCIERCFKHAGVYNCDVLKALQRKRAARCARPTWRAAASAGSLTLERMLAIWGSETEGTPRKNGVMAKAC